ncbi:MAG: MarR family transcriptional regulator [Chloroflexota bacterium]|jgi:DNA-binding MarR family transcriptional regulator
MGKKAKGKGKPRKKERKRAQRLAEAGAPAELAEPEPAVVIDLALEQRRRAVDTTELAARLAGLSTVLQRHLSRADAGEGLTRARLSALALLVLGGPRTLGDLAAAEHVRPPTMTRLIRAMEADGLVVRERNPDDGRSIVIQATPRGMEQLERGRTRQIAPLAESIADLDRAERLQLEDAADLLGRVLRDTAWENPAGSE